MLRRAIDTAHWSCLFSAVYVSTDHEDIALKAKDYGALAHLRRGGEDDGTKGTQQIAFDLVRERGTELALIHEIWVLYPCTPLLRPEDLVDASFWMKQNMHDFLVAVGTEPLRDAGAFYASKRRALMGGDPFLGTHTTMYALPEERVCDINTPEDWAEAERKYDALGTEVVQ